MARGLILECNDVIDADGLAKQCLADKLATLSWFDANEQQVRYSVNTNKIGISKKNSGVKKSHKAAGSQKRQRDDGWQGQFGPWDGGAGHHFGSGSGWQDPWPLFQQMFPAGAAQQGQWYQDSQPNFRPVRRRLECQQSSRDRTSPTWNSDFLS